MDTQPIVMPEDTKHTHLLSGAGSSGNLKEDNLKHDHVQATPPGTENMEAGEDGTEDDEKVELYAEVTGPQWHRVNSCVLSKPIMASNLPRAFKKLPIFGRPKCMADLESFQDQALRKFMGLPDDEYEKVLDYCSAVHLSTGREMQMSSQRPTQGQLGATLTLRDEDRSMAALPDTPRLQTLAKLKRRINTDYGNMFVRKLKYRGIRLLAAQDSQKADVNKPPDMEPGKDILYRVRIYRPFMYSVPGAKREDGIQTRVRHSVFNCDVVLAGRQRLTDLQERFVCRNDLDLRTDMSQQPNNLLRFSSKESFPSNFMFINNVFYVDSRQNCKDLSAVLRAFAQERRLGSFPTRDMRSRLHRLPIRLAHPEVYVHQGNCEHIFQFSEIRLLNSWDPLHLSSYPHHTAASHNQTLYCNTCAEFSARWIVTGSHRVPFDPAYFCDTCFHSYMYKDGVKLENFKAFHYKGNEINVLKPAAAEETPSGHKGDEYEVQCRYDPITTRPNLVLEVTPLR